MFRDGRLIVHEGEVRPRSDVEWERDRKAKIAAMSDLELDVMIQTHISPLLAEWGRVERRRRAELSATVPPARSSSMRSEEHTSELQSLMRISYAVFCLKKNN